MEEQSVQHLTLQMSYSMEIASGGNVTFTKQPDIAGDFIVLDTLVLMQEITCFWMGQMVPVQMR